MEDAQRPLLTRRLPAAGMALPVVLAVAFQLAGPRARPMAAASSRPALAFDQYLVDLGPVGPSEEVHAHFDFTNRGHAPVHVTQFVPSCGCLQPQMKKTTYAPGESGSFVVRVQTANQNAGPKEYTVAIRYNDPEPREANVVFRADLPENQVFVRPTALMILKPGEESIPPQHIDITDRRGKGRHLNITGAECTRQFVEVEIEEGEVDQNGNWHEHLKVSVPGRLPPGLTPATIHITTDDPDYARLRVPLKLQGPSSRKIIDRHLQPAGSTAPAARH